MRKPDFFLVGHPRSGSGQMNGYLSRHPQVFMAKKELHYFGSDLGYHEPPRTVANYHAFFDDVPDTARRVGEASTWYLFSEKAAEEIAAYDPDATIIALLRNPVTLLHSLHSHFVFRGDEDIVDFAEALDAERGRTDGSRTEPEHHIPRLGLRYGLMPRYADQLRRYFEHFGRERVHVIINDDFRDDPRAVFRGACRALGVDEDFEGLDEVFAPNARARNSNRTVWSRRVQDFLIHPGRQQVLEAVRPAKVPGYRFSLRAMRRMNLRYVDRALMDPAVKQALKQRFRPEVEDLSELLGRDLSAWVA